MIDPITREEILLAKALGENVPDIVPIIRKEMYLAKIAGADIPTPQAITREEKYLDAIANGTECTLEPITRKEMFYAKSAGQDVQTPTPITRIEMFLSQIAGGGGGGEQPVYHTVKFYNGDVLLGSAQVLHGKSASYTGSEPTMENTDQYYYTFIGWSKTKGGVASDDALTNVTSNRSVYAAFVSTVRSYNVYFYNDYGTELLYETPVEYGSDAMYVGAEPTKESTAQYTYTFAGWSATPGGSADPNILNNITVGGNFYAVFTATVRTYTVRFINDSTVLQTVTVLYGGSAIYTGDDPVKEGDWAFKGWSPEPTNIAADTDCYAQFKSTALTWDDVFAYIADGSYRDNLNIGDTIPLDLGAEGVVRMEIVAIDADEKADGSGNAPITWIAKDLLATTRTIKASNDRTGDWAGTTLRNWLQGDFYNAIPADVRGSIVTVNKTYRNNVAGATKTCADNVWIPSAREIFGGDVAKCEESGLHYENSFSSVDSLKKGDYWWLRTSDNPYAYKAVAPDGRYAVNASTNIGVIIGFCT